jgi:hypothetical protein
MNDDPGGTGFGAAILGRTHPPDLEWLASCYSAEVANQVALRIPWHLEQLLRRMAGNQLPRVRSQLGKRQQDMRILSEKRHRHEWGWPVALLTTKRLTLPTVWP